MKLRRKTSLILFSLIVSATLLFAFLYLPSTDASTAIFGYDTIGSGSAVGIENYIRGCAFATTTGGIADSISVALATADNWTGNVKLGIYTTDYALVGVTENRELSPTDTYTWYHFNFSDPKPSINASTTYFICTWALAGTGVVNAISDTGTNDNWYKASADGSYPDPLTSPASGSDKKVSIYVTYTVTGASPNYLGVSTDNATSFFGVNKTQVNSVNGVVLP